jgi:hypothetical protein
MYIGALEWKECCSHKEVDAGRITRAIEVIYAVGQYLGTWNVQVQNP